MNKVFVYGSLCNYTQLKEVLGRIPQNCIGTLNGFKRNNTATWEFYKNSKKNKKWFLNNGKFIKFQPSYLTLEKDNTSKTTGLVITITDKELHLLDDREGVLDKIPCYKRVKVTLVDNSSAWAYLAINTTITKSSKCPSEYINACENDLATAHSEILSNFNAHKSQFTLPIIETDGVYSLNKE